MSKTLIVDRDVATPMRDGVTLRADVYRPRTRKPLPVVLVRTPYGKGASNPAFAMLAAERGYAVVIQDTRGRWVSDGIHYPFVDEKNDGYDTVEWAACQEWANGSVGMLGGSYVGYTQWSAAAMQPPALKTIIPTVTFCDPYRVSYTGGAVSLGVMVSWILTSAAQMTITRMKDSAQKDQLMDQLIEMADGMARGKTFSHLPLAEMPLIGKDGIEPFFTDILQHPSHDAYWKRLKCEHTRIQVPALHVGGWYDIFAAETLRDFNGICQNGGTELARQNQKLLMGPWLHGPFEGLVGEVDFGMRASAGVMLLDEMQLRWFDHWLKGEKNGIMDEAPVRLFVMGANQWRDEHEFPLARTRYVPYYLHSTGTANSLNGDGLLSPEKPLDEPVDSYIYDPRHPVPTRGGGLCCSQAALPGGAYDQRGVEARPDVLVYSTPPLEHDLEVTGPLQVHLWASTSAPDTDFTAKLVDVHTCGYARNIQEGIVRASRVLSHRPKPGEAVEYTIDLWATSNVFKAGHRVRVEISSSSFPRFERNLNTGSDVVRAASVPALQMVFHDNQHPSYILLPVILS